MNLKELIREIPNFPQDGVSYKDITPLLKDPAGLSAAVQTMLAPFADADVDLVVGIEARGFVFATPIALELGCGFVPVRKPGKLPAATLSRDYALEYGETALEIHTDAIASGQKVLVVDDVLATGGNLGGDVSSAQRTRSGCRGHQRFGRVEFSVGPRPFTRVQIGKRYRLLKPEPKTMETPYLHVE